MIFCVLAAAAALVGCGGASAGSTAGGAAAPAQRNTTFNGNVGGTSSNSTSSGAGGTSSGGQAGNGQAGGTATPPAGPQYLVKSLAVSMAVKDPRQTAAALQTWMVATDPRATSEGLNYAQIGTDEYNVSLTFAVEASVYPQIESYLAGYPEKQGGQLLNLQESVQDVTNDYIDTQARLSNLRNEEQQLQAILSKEQSLSDVLTVEQQVATVEGQIEQIEAHLNALSGQTTYYMVTISLSPLGAPSLSPVKPQPFDPGGTLRDALAAALVVAEWLANVLIWVVVFSLFAIPVGLVALGVRRVVAVVRRRRAPVTVG